MHLQLIFKHFTRIKTLIRINQSKFIHKKAVTNNNSSKFIHKKAITNHI